MLSCNNITERLNDILTSNGFLNRISIATQFSKNTAMAIDHCYTNVLENGWKSGVVISDVSDHLPFFFLLVVN